MNRSQISAFVLCLAGLSAVTNDAYAQRGGGGHGGGAYHGSAAYHGGAYHGGYYHGGYYHGGYYHGGYWWGPGFGIGIGFYPYYYGAGPYWYNPIIISPGYSYVPPVVVPGQPSAGDTFPPQPSPSNEPAPKNAQIKVLLPDANAKVWFDGNATTSTGAERLFHTPDLAPGATSNYRIRAAWTANGKEVVQELVVPVQSGRGSVADFTRPASERIAPPPPAK
jgi:uncharacterized protein (TIGR03000 family)